jgi:hypothetical protein
MTTSRFRKVLGSATTWMQSRGPVAFFAVCAIALLVVLSGVGITMAATGGFQFLAQAEPTITPSTSVSPTPTPTPTSPESNIEGGTGTNGGILFNAPGCKEGQLRWQIASPGYIQIFFETTTQACAAFSMNLPTLVQCSTVTEVWVRNAPAGTEDWSAPKVYPVTSRNPCPGQVFAPAPPVTLAPLAPGAPMPPPVLSPSDSPSPTGTPTG